MTLLLKHGFPFEEASQSVLAEACYALLSLLKRLLAVGMRLRVELVGIAHEFLLQCLRKEVLMWQRQVLIYYLLPCQSCPGVSLADPRMAWEALTSHYLTANQAMTQIRLHAMTAYPRSVATEDAYVVEHGRLLHKLAVEMKLRVGVADGE